MSISKSHSIHREYTYANGVTDLRYKLKLWDYKEMLDVHENLEYIKPAGSGVGEVLGILGDPKRTV